ncbi:hypothetical protein KZO01_16610 [Kurthia zopfii]|uniref:Uncharacterized protein n=1 Tax=Kurthia zopfii TaxID=1650 RepID=A0A8B4QA14_9BACL|nr:hypothetical protein [Kurthia zopfii]PWI21633.1 hypothetical protein DF281_11260 [Kurthia zopfii]TDR35174.1 hypothetical protein DFR61_13224 [Kurthia zopfii]GEK31352.1 hypothetical protein KZO01_16610 [Kurthia zopfii]STX09528.1 Uncharacterised protein [Kurthia zopfii]
MLKDFFPTSLASDVTIVEKLIKKQRFLRKKLDISPTTTEYKVGAEIISIPTRIYFDEMAEVNFRTLTKQQQLIAICLYTRHQDGFIREKYVRKLLSLIYEDWCMSYIFSLSREYVVEIVQVIYDELSATDSEKFAQFCAENPVEFEKGYAQMTSYWNEYERREQPAFKNYVGTKLYRQIFKYNRSYARIAYQRSAQSAIKKVRTQMEFDYYLQYIEKKDIRINGEQCRTSEQLFETFRKALKQPKGTINDWRSFENALEQHLAKVSDQQMTVFIDHFDSISENEDFEKSLRKIKITSQKQERHLSIIALSKTTAI